MPEDKEQVLSYDELYGHKPVGEETEDRIHRRQFLDSVTLDAVMVHASPSGITLYINVGGGDQVIVNTPEMNPSALKFAAQRLRTLSQACRDALLYTERMYADMVSAPVEGDEEDV